MIPGSHPGPRYLRKYKRNSTKTHGVIMRNWLEELLQKTQKKSQEKSLKILPEKHKKKFLKKFFINLWQHTWKTSTTNPGRCFRLDPGRNSCRYPGRNFYTNLWISSQKCRKQRRKRNQRRNSGIKSDKPLDGILGNLLKKFKKKKDKSLGKKPFINSELREKSQKESFEKLRNSSKRELRWKPKKESQKEMKESWQIFENSLIVTLRILARDFQKFFSENCQE